MKMMMKNNLNIDEQRVMSLFNKRDVNSFVSVYSLFFDDLCHFSNNLFHLSDIEGADVVHDMFIYVWEKKELKFDSLDGLKSYFYIGIKNKFKNFIEKNKHLDKYKDYVAKEDNFFVSQMVISESVSLISEAYSYLPEDCLEIFKLYMNGLSIKEIVEIVGKGKTYVYERKQKAFDILKKKFSNLYMFTW